MAAELSLPGLRARGSCFRRRSERKAPQTVLAEGISGQTCGEGRGFKANGPARGRRAGVEESAGLRKKPRRRSNRCRPQPRTPSFHSRALVERDSVRRPRLLDYAALAPARSRLFAAPDVGFWFCLAIFVLTSENAVRRHSPEKTRDGRPVTTDTSLRAAPHEGAGHGCSAGDFPGGRAGAKPAPARGEPSRQPLGPDFTRTSPKRADLSAPAAYRDGKGFGEGEGDFPPQCSPIYEAGLGRTTRGHRRGDEQPRPVWRSRATIRRRRTLLTRAVSILEKSSAADTEHRATVLSKKLGRVLDNQGSSR